MQPLAAAQAAPRTYYVVMGDLVRSEQSTSTERLHRDFNLAVDAANIAYGSALSSPLTITLGDEFQGLVQDLTAALAIVRQVRWRLLNNGVRCRFVIGLVNLATPLNPNRAWNMMGPGLATARETLEQKRDPNAYRFSLPDQPTLQILMDGVGRALTDIEEGWTERQREVLLASFNQDDGAAALAERFKVRESVFYKIRRAAKFDLYATLWSALGQAALTIDQQQTQP
ncbi:SatD family protein [Caulobacter segnis]